MFQPRWRPKVLALCALAALCAGTALTAAAQSPAPATTRPTSLPSSLLNVSGVHLLPAHGSTLEASELARFASASQQATHGFSTATNLSYHGGPVMHSVTAHAIFWKPSGYGNFDGGVGSVGTDATYQSTIASFFGDVGPTNFTNIVTQYPDGAGAPPAAFAYGGSWVDTTSAPASGANVAAGQSIQDSDIQAEVLNAIAANSSNGWTTGMGNIYFVFTPLGVNSCADGQCSFSSYCAYHGSFVPLSGTYLGQTVLYANMPDGGTGISLTNGKPSGPCWGAINGSPWPVAPGADLDAYATLNVTSHEQFESVTDPEGTAWYDSQGNEIGDKCAWDFGAMLAGGGDVMLNNSGAFTLQEEWSNAALGCALNYGTVGGGGGGGGSSTVSATVSTVVASTTSVPADGTHSATITVTLLTSGGQPVSGKSVSLTAGSSHAAITPSTGTSNGSGVVSFTTTDTTPETATYTAADTTDSITFSQSNQQPSVTFTPVTAGPMVLSGTLSRPPSQGTTTLSADVNGTPCGSSVIVSRFGPFSNLQLPASCGSGAITFFVTNSSAGYNQRAVGIETRGSRSPVCLPFTAGSNVSSVTLSISWPQLTGC